MQAYMRSLRIWRKCSEVQGAMAPCSTYIYVYGDNHHPGCRLLLVLSSFAAGDIQDNRGHSQGYWEPLGRTTGRRLAEKGDVINGSKHSCQSAGRLATTNLGQECKEPSQAQIAPRCPSGDPKRGCFCSASLSA